MSRLAVVCLVLASAGAALAGDADALGPRPPTMLRPWRVIPAVSAALNADVPAVTSYLFSRSAEPRMRVVVDDREGSLRAFAVTVNGAAQGSLDRDGWLDEGRPPRGFDPGGSTWAVLRGARRGLNHLMLTPVYDLTGSPLGPQLRVEWAGQIHLQGAVTADPLSMLRGLRELEEAEERVYFHLRHFDQLLRDLPRCCFPDEFLRSARCLPGELRRAVADARSGPFLDLLGDFHAAAWGTRPDTVGISEATVGRLADISWLWESPGSHPLAAWLYATNPEKIFLHPYLGDVLLAKRATKNAYLALASPREPLTEAALDAMETALRDETGRLSDLVRVVDAVAEACRRRADEVYEKFPWWRGLFRTSFDAKVRATIWPGRAYPVRQDLFLERVMLDEYLRVVREFARQDLQSAKVRLRTVAAFGRFPAAPLAVPSLKPWHPEDGPGPGPGARTGGGE